VAGQPGPAGLDVELRVVAYGTHELKAVTGRRLLRGKAQQLEGHCARHIDHSVACISQPAKGDETHRHGQHCMQLWP